MVGVFHHPTAIAIKGANVEYSDWLMCTVGLQATNEYISTDIPSIHKQLIPNTTISAKIYCRHCNSTYYYTN